MVANGDNVNTVNLPHADMLWYFIEAENDNGTQYYYIVNNATGKYICNSDYSSQNRTIKLATFEADNTDKFKFKLVENNDGGTTGYYNIDIKPNGSGWLGLNKQSGQVESTYPVRLTNDAFINDDNSRWKFIAFDNNFSWPAPPFTLSPGDTKTYYRIRNQQNTNYFISTGSGTPTYVTISNIADNKMAWYFKEAATDDSGMKCKYYYIINPAENKYMYFNGDTRTSDQSDAIEIKEKNSEVEDRYQFLVIQAARVGAGETPIECYMIVPK